MMDLVLLSAATLAAGFLRGVTGFGFALAAVPLYSLSIPPIEAVILAQLLQIAASPTDILHNHRSVDTKALRWLCLGALIFTPIGASFATRLPPDIMRLTIAVVVLMGLAALVAKVNIRDGKGPAITAGAVAGLLAGLAAMPGPPAVAYFLGRGGDNRTRRASLLVFFSFTAVIALTTLAIGSDVLRWGMLLKALACYPALMAGTWLGTRLFLSLGDGHYRVAALGVLFVSAVLTGIKGLSGLI